MTSGFAGDTFFNDARLCLNSAPKCLSVYYSSVLQIAVKIELSMTCLSKTLFQKYKLSLRVGFGCAKL